LFNFIIGAKVPKVSKEAKVAKDPEELEMLGRKA